VIRPFGLRDVLTIKQLQSQSVSFDLRRLLLCSSPPLRSALVGYFSRYHWGAVTCVSDGRDGQPSGFCQVYPRENRPEWELARLAPSLDECPGAGELWIKLLASLIVQGAERGVLRIMARATEDAEVEDLFRGAGFAVVARKEVFVSTDRPSPAPRPRGLRRYVDQDRGAVEHLQRQVVPQLAQRAQDVVRYGCSGASVGPLVPVSTEGYVWTEKQRLVGYLGITSSSRGSWIEVLVRPEYRADALPHIRYVLTRARRSGVRPIYCPVPDYIAGIGWLLRTLGFQSYTRQAIMVAQTLARVRSREQVVVPGLQGSVDVSAP